MAQCRKKYKLRPIYGIVLGLGVLYYILIRLTSFRIPCLFRMITGLQCPGCGVTRMILAMARLDFRSAFHYNPAIFCLLPVWGISYAVFFIAQPRCLAQDGWLFRVITYGTIGVLLVFGVVRNLPI